MDCFAPGRSIESAGLGGTFFIQDGTSMAAPFVAGAFAVLRQAAPNAPLAHLINALTHTGTPITDARAGAPGTTIRPLIQVD